MEKNLVDGKPELPLGTKLSENIESFIDSTYYADKIIPEDFILILKQMFTLMRHHRYGVLYNILKKFS